MHGHHAGEENLDFVESIRKSSIKLIVTRHEQTGGFMAAIVGRLTGTAGVCLATLGPGEPAQTSHSCACQQCLGCSCSLVHESGPWQCRRDQSDDSSGIWSPGRLPDADDVCIMSPLVVRCFRIVCACMLLRA